MSGYRRIFKRLTASLFTAIALSASAAYAQVATADLTGRVLDQNGAAVPGATVTARNLGTGFARTAGLDWRTCAQQYLAVYEEAAGGA